MRLRTAGILLAFAVACDATSQPTSYEGIYVAPGAGVLELAATAMPGGAELISALGVAFGLEGGGPRPVLTVRDLAGGRVWRS